jgi:hypothetical protein
MTPKEKAEELVKVYYKLLPISASFEYSLNICKQCALIAVDEILKSNPNDPYPGGYYETEQDRINSCIYYWQEVKQEIEKL